MRIGLLQFNPQVGDVDNNLTKADRLLNQADPENLDLLVLPEMAFSGYNFKSLRHIHDYLEPTDTGISSLWARTTALKFSCNVLVGYPETADVSHKWPTAPEYFNSAVVIGPDGDMVAHTRKTHLYYTDDTWALENPKTFYEGHITGLGQVAIGICMDLNPYKFEAPWEDFEFGTHAVNSDANVIVVTMAWNTMEPQALFTSNPHEPDMSSLVYWLKRLEPVIRAESNDEVIVVFANRCGAEDEVTYVGTSAVVGIRGGEVSVYGLLGRGEKKLLVVDTNKPPHAKLMLTPMGITMSQTGPGGVPQVSQTATVDHRKDYNFLLAKKQAALTPLRTTLPFEFPRREERISPPRLTIPPPRVRGIMQDIPTPEGPSPTPGHHRPNIDAVFAAASAARPGSRVPDSAISLGPGDGTRLSQELRNKHASIRDSRDSGLGYASPEMRSSVGSQLKSSPPHQRSSLRNSETVRTESIKASSKRREDSPSLRIETGRDDRSNRERSRRERERERERERDKGRDGDDGALPSRFLDSPVFKKPDSSILSYWLETLPTASTPQPYGSQSTGTPRPPSASPIKTLQESSPVRSEAVATGSPIHACRNCGHGLVNGAEGKRPASTDLRSNGTSGKMRPNQTAQRQRTNSSARRPRQREEGEDVQEWRRLVQEELDRRQKEESQERPIINTNEVTISVSEIVSLAEVSEYTRGSESEKEIVTEQTPLHDQLSMVDDNSKKSPPRIAASKMSTKVDFIPVDSRPRKVTIEEVDPMAPRNEIVPPPIHGMNKVIYTSERPKSLAW